METSKRKCAYCGKSENLSREHIFPGSIIKRYEDNLISISDKSDKYFKADLVVRDVCEPCNNGILSNLDSQLISIFDKYMHHPIQPGDSAELSFDYHSLLRVLLKISYNSARASSDGMKAVKALKKYVPYILGKTKTAPEIILRLQIVTSAKKFNTVTQKVEGMMEAHILRSAKLPYDGPQKANFIIRLVALNSFWFYLIVPTKKVSQSKMQSLIAGLETLKIQPGVSITENMGTIHIPKEKTTYIHPTLLTGMIRNNA